MIKSASQQRYTIAQLQEMLRHAETVDEIRVIRNLFPILSEEEREKGHRRLDDGIYRNGMLVGEKHPDD
jgi:hypothetical protein